MTADKSASPLALRPIGIVRSPFTEAAETPIQPVYAAGARGKVIVEAALEAALADIDGFERLWLVYWLDRADPFQPRIVPYRDTREHGLFATRSPCRPNPLGMSVVRLLGREGCVLHVADVDILDGTPLLDIKPYVPEFDAFPCACAGWLEEPGIDRRVADGRFHRAPSGSAPDEAG